MYLMNMDELSMFQENQQTKLTGRQRNELSSQGEPALQMASFSPQTTQQSPRTRGYKGSHVSSWGWGQGGCQNMQRPGECDQQLV